ncbi:UBAP1-MVB12-associated (UMA)-domain containing protein 1 [Sphaerodactylus townsendi]|uniref:UBAP1-MVB12-associated (UMA)-domain containing protein 1 n=1 Tax=Sphaerodactylus townsendi TaxID=933632 RepID=UPI002026E055|nr:UBAP1-MVB12-associated (UMA)-domain containing protein 1 [Sphaerodactylus townsendi]
MPQSNSPRFTQANTWREAPLPLFTGSQLVTTATETRRRRALPNTRQRHFRRGKTDCRRALGHALLRYFLFLSSGYVCCEPGSELCEGEKAIAEGNSTSEERNEFKDQISCSTGLDQTLQKNSDSRSNLTGADTAVGTEKNHNVESSPFMSELLSDVPFALAPHVLAAQDSCSDFPQQLLSYDVNDNLARFWYDFTLENSVLCES